MRPETPDQPTDPETQAMLEEAGRVEDAILQGAMLQHLQGRVVALNVEVRRAHAALEAVQGERELLQARVAELEASQPTVQNAD